MSEEQPTGRDLTFFKAGHVSGWAEAIEAAAKLCDPYRTDLAKGIRALKPPEAGKEEGPSDPGVAPEPG